MAKGGFVVKFEGKDKKKKKIQRCYAVSLDYDEWSYTINNTNHKHNIPPGVKKITLKVE